jgi:hypothetical protein
MLSSNVTKRLEFLMEVPMPTLPSFEVKKKRGVSETKTANFNSRQVQIFPYGRSTPLIKLKNKCILAELLPAHETNE